MNTPESIVVTGLGLIGPFGDSEDDLAAALDGNVGVFGECTGFVTNHLFAEIKDFRLSNYLKNPRAERTPRISQLALASAAQALKAAGLGRSDIANERTAIVYGTGNGPAVSTERSLDAIATNDLSSIEPLVFQESVFNAPASLVCIHFGIKGPVIVQPMGWTAGVHALRQGCDLLRRGAADRILVIAADELAKATHDALDRLGFVSPNDGGEERLSPYDAQVNGAIFGEGAVAVMLEREGAARERGAIPRAKIAGCSIGSDPQDPPVVIARKETVARTIERALAQAGKGVADVDHVFGGTIVTRESDDKELAALQLVFGERQHPCPVSSIKSTIGETVGPSSLFSVAAGIIEIERGRLFANRQLEPRKLDGIELPQRTKEQRVRCVLVNALGLSGACATVVLEGVSP